jgi:hypothetical protein
VENRRAPAFVRSLCFRTVRCPALMRLSFHSLDRIGFASRGLPGTRRDWEHLRFGSGGTVESQNGEARRPIR